jgi:lipopolysaccharide/colanic/teichoic acid biosynthesis glycosyltransferase
MPYRTHVKRVVDFMIALVALAVFAPAMLAVAVMVRLKLGGPVLFRQQRPGLHGRPFTMVKFRTMHHACDGNGVLRPDGERLDGFGRTLRATSLDELPELWNVLRGDMSLVGPRPLLMEYLPRYSPREARRHEVRPGITGWAQVNGRNAASWNERFERDLWYVDNNSIALDARILLLTVLRVLRRDGIAAQGEATMHPFTGHA